jgi:hypothetical protein
MRLRGKSAVFRQIVTLNQILNEKIQKPNSWTYNVAEVSEHNLGSSHTWGFCIQCLHYKTSSNHFCSGGGGGIKSFSSGDFCPNYVKEFGLRYSCKAMASCTFKSHFSVFSSHFGTFVYTNIHTDHTMMYVKSRCILYFGKKKFPYRC